MIKSAVNVAFPACDLKFVDMARTIESSKRSSLGFISNQFHSPGFSLVMITKPFLFNRFNGFQKVKPLKRVGDE